MGLGRRYCFFGVRFGLCLARRIKSAVELVCFNFGAGGGYRNFIFIELDTEEEQ